MSSDKEQNSSSAAIPLLVPVKKKQTGKPKKRVRPSRPLKKNGPLKRKILPRKPILKAQKDASDPVDSSVDLSSSAQGSQSESVSASLSAPVASKILPQKNKVLLRKPLRKPIKPIRASKSSSSVGVKRGHSINTAGSAMNKKRSSISIGSSKRTTEQTQENVNENKRQQQAPQMEEQGVQSNVVTDESANDSLQLGTEGTEDWAEQETADLANATEATTNETEKTAEETEIVPYQHLGQLDPALKIEPPKPNEKTMKDFCSRFKIPKELKARNREDDNANGENANNEGNQAQTANGNGAAAANVDPSARTEPENDNRSGPLVEIINGEIVIKESSMIVGGRQTTEEVDRELDGAVVVEESTGITATYNSFTKRQKTSRWTVEETRKFYLALRQCGTDFTTMESFFDGGEDGTSTKRNRKQLKSKYKRECRKNLKLIDMAMNPKVQIPLDLSVFGELDMDAVEKVVPLGQASVAGGDSNITAAVGSDLNGDRAVVTPEQGMTPVGGQEYDELNVVVEDMSEENTAPVVVSQTQELNVSSLDGSKIGENDNVPIEASMADEKQKSESTLAVEAVSNIPLLTMPTTSKKKARPKFRARAKPKPGAKGRPKPKRAIKK